ncbi:substrate-binding domain-containing protein [Streptomyces sp. NBC_00158]|uniref:substrate-binding domain-containing protein n=1 Tax=Streptomyces sp. NBC_00158 TaxID=2903627 RepID=UPI0038646AFE
MVCDNAASLTALLDHVHGRGARAPALLAPEATSARARALRTAAASWSTAHGIPVTVHTVPFADLGRTVGRDFQLASCVDGVAARSCDPPVTAIDLRPTAYGRTCADLLCDVLAGRTPPDTVRRHDWALESRASTRLGT